MIQVSCLVLVIAALVSDAAQVIEVLMPEPYIAPDAPVRAPRYPMGSTPCDYAIREAIDISRGCLQDYEADQPNQYYCQDPYGCRMSLTKSVHVVASVCGHNRDLFPTIRLMFEQIAFHTSKACPSTTYSCDLQSSLVLSMQTLWMNSTETRAYECSPCVKQSFGRHNDVSGKARCNKIGSEYCHVDGNDLIARDHLCRPCTQRHWAKKLSADGINGIDNDSARFIRACYDDGEGHTCYSKVAAYLQQVHSVVIDPDGVFRNRGDFRACAHANACTDPACLTHIQTLIDGVGCCAPAIPIHLQLNFGLPCLTPMIEKTIGLDASCTAPATMFIDVTVATDDSADSVCQAVRQDLATTLAVLPDLIECAGGHDPNGGQVTVRASVAGYRASGALDKIPFDPDRLQYPVLAIQCSAIA